MKVHLATLSLGVLLASTACRRDRPPVQADSGLARDLALASAQTATPTFQDTAIAPAPVKAEVEPKKPDPAPVRKAAPPAPKKETPAPTPPKQEPTPAPAIVPQPQPVAPAPAPVAEIASGTSGVLTTGNKVCSGANMVGDKIVATLDAPITGSNGANIPAGSNVVLEVASITSGDKAETASITFRVRSVMVGDKTYTVSADATPVTQLEKTKVAGASSGGDDKKKVIGGAIAGAVLGQVLGRSAKGAIIGAAAGAATGAVVAKQGGSAEKWDACLPSGAQMQIKLNAPLVLM